MTAGEIFSAELPNGSIFQAAMRAAGRMDHAGMAMYRLVEVWADGHTVWHGPVRDDPVVVTPSSELIRTRG